MGWIAAIAAAAAGVAGGVIGAEQTRKANRQARILAEQQRADTLAAREEAKQRAEGLNAPLYTSSDINRMLQDYSNTLYGGAQAGLQSIRDSLAARGLSKSGLSDEQIFNFNLQQAIAQARGANQILTQTKAQNRGALTNYINMANAATLGLQPTLNQQTTGLQQIALNQPYTQMWNNIGSQTASGIGGAYGMYESGRRFDQYMNLLRQQQASQQQSPQFGPQWNQNWGGTKPWNQNWNNANQGY